MFTFTCFSKKILRFVEAAWKWRGRRTGEVCRGRTTRCQFTNSGGRVIVLAVVVVGCNQLLQGGVVVIRDPDVPVGICIHFVATQLVQSAEKDIKYYLVAPILKVHEKKLLLYAFNR